MRLKYYLCSLLILNMSCNNHSQDNSTNSNSVYPASESGKNSNGNAHPVLKEKVATSLPKKNNEQDHKKNSCSEPIKTKTLINQACVDRIHTGVEIIRVTEQWAKENGVLDLYQADPGFTKWCILFHDIPGDPPYSFQQKRLLQPNRNQYYPCGYAEENILASKNCNMPAPLMVSSRGYLPGEKITIRLSGKDAHKEIIFYPRPLLLKDKTGRVLAKVALLSAIPGQTHYDLDLSGIGKEEKYTLISHSGGEILSHNYQGPIKLGISPEVVGKRSGFANIILRMEDGTEYNTKLPWGNELLECKAGNK
jgi:hypothetical protein